MKPYSEWTKEEFIEEHRKMWNWIAEELGDEQFKNCIGLPTIIVILKDLYMSNQKIDSCNTPFDRCYACECAIQQSRRHHTLTKNIYDGEVDCICCPFEWGNGINICFRFGGEYFKIQQTKDQEEAIRLARKIANLPVREEI